MRGLVQPLCEIGTMVTIPARLGWTRVVTMPLPLEGAVVRLSVEPLILMRIPCTALPCWETRIVSVVLRPTNSVFGDTRTAVQYTTGGTNGPFTTTEAEAVVVAGFVSCCLATLGALLAVVPVTPALVASVMGTG